ncbi:sel1 repeat family protein [Enterobacteriaceae bacterium YMB-R21]|uniref:Sel1 repeat family protein n=2 Tax=Tenebrionicola larvae TaxID=2815733 RepID=A0A949Q755_9ENTR|nr:sel1 repeat family protein [Tenebrionicola larvae]
MNMASVLLEEKLQFTCINEADNRPPLDPDADGWFKQARILEKTTGPKDYEAIGALYRKAISRDHYKAMRNLQNLLMDGLVKPLPGKTAPEEAVSIVERMISLNIPAGYYAMGYYLEMGYGVEQDKSASIVYFRKSADLGSPEGQYKIGGIFLAKYLPDIGENPAYRPEIGKKMLICSVNQGNAQAGYKLGNYYKQVNKDYALSVKYYQLAVKNGSLTAALQLKNSFDNPSDKDEMDYLKLEKDSERVRRYGIIQIELRHHPDARFPDIDKIVPLPPAELPAWDGTFEYKKAR